MTKTPKQPAPPKHLSPEARALWDQLRASFVLDDPGALAMLRLACECFDRAERARRTIDRDGEIVRDRFNQPKVHPLIAAERDARGQLLMALRALKLDPGAIEGGDL